MLLSSLEQDHATAFAGVAVRLVGPLMSMPLREARELIRSHGGELVAATCEADVVIVGDRVGGEEIEAIRLDAAAGDRGPELLTEPLFLQRLLDAESGAAVRGLHSPSMLAEVVGAPVAAIRRWHRRGYLKPTQELGRLPLFDLCEAQVARRLAGLIESGCSLTQIDARVSRLESQVPGVERPLVSLTLEVHDGRLLIRDRERLTEPNGQVVVDFEAPAEDEQPVAIQLPVITAEVEKDAETLRLEAWEMADRGEHGLAVEACRLVLLSDDARPEDHFLLAQLLYEQGDVTGARERYYTAIELDDSFVEARINLGCVLAELGDEELAVAVLQGAVDAAPGLADARYHLARALDQLNRAGEAEAHWRRFLELSPVGPWSEEARGRLSADA